MKHSSDIVDVSRIVTAIDALTSLQLLDTRLHKQGLREFGLFNHAYVIVTGRILKAISMDYFEEPSIIDAFIVTFVMYYFEALNDIGTEKLPSMSPWTKLEEYARIQHAPIFLSLLIGANAHINNDLPRALKVFVDTRGNEHSLADLKKISKILMQSGKEITKSFDEPNKFYDFLKRRLRFTYYRPAMYTILYWRILAWRNYRRLEKDTHAAVSISVYSLRIANRLLCISRILSWNTHRR